MEYRRGALENRIQCPKCLKRLEEWANFCPSCGEDLRGLTPTADTLSGPWSGRVIDGRYRLVEKLGEGGMGSVFKVEHVRMGKVLALKLLRPDLCTDKKMKQRFHQEARVVSKLSHPNTIQVFDFGELEDGSLYIAMEFLPGRDLMWSLRTHGAFTEERAISIGIQVLASLSEAHDLGIIHRDIKPANVMLVRRKDGGDEAKVLDFGIAKLNEGESRKHITGVADFVGTPAYISPEQARGEPLDARSDLYSVGAMMFELLTGQGVFDGPTPMSIVSKHMSEPPPRFSQVAPDKVISPALEQVIRKALEKERTDRFAGADEMRRALEKVRRDIADKLTDYTPAAEVNTALMASREDFESFERNLRRRRAVAPAFVLLLLAAGGFAGWHFLLRPQPDVLLSAEREPNNEPNAANRIALGSPVTGRMGRATDSNTSDQDLFVADVPEDGALSVELQGVPDMNLVLEILQFSGDGPVTNESGRVEAKLSHVVVLDDGRTGAGERVDGVRVKKGPVYVRVQEKAHASEPVRPPRETTQHDYALTLRASTADERLESEPANDRAETAPPSSPGRAVRAFTGSALTEGAARFEQSLSSVDVFRVEAEEQPARTWALVVPPEAGRLAVFDEHEVERWRKAVASAARVVRTPEPVETRGQPVVVPLQEGTRGFAIRVHPMVPSKLGASGDPSELLKQLTPPGSPYYVAFFADREGGLDGVLDLVTVLETEGLRGSRDKVVDAVRGALKGSAHLAAFEEKVNALVASEAVR